MPIELNEKQALQEAEYDVPIHWELPRAEGLKYRCLSELIASLIAAVPGVRRAGAVTFIDLGCGDGSSTSQITGAIRKMGLEVNAHGFDYSDRAIALAREKTATMENSPRFSVQPVETLAALPEGSGPTVVLMREVVEHLTEAQIDSTLEKLKELCPHFHLVVTTPSDNSPVEPKHERHYSEAHLTATLTRNQLEAVQVMGFSFRPRFLFPLLVRLKSGLNRRPFFWRLTRPLWRPYPPGWSQTLVAVAQYPATD